MTDLLQPVRALVAAGLSLIPCADDTKLPIGYLLPIKRDANGQPVINPQTGRPKHTWKDYQRRLATDAELRYWFVEHEARPAVVYGWVSGHAELFDFDKPDSGGDDPFQAWYAELCRISPALAARLCIVRTPSGAHHVPTRCPEIEIPTHHMLAAKYWLHPTDPDSDRAETLIETRGEGGYGLCPPSNGYTYLQGSRLDLPVISAAERDILREIARQFTVGAPRPKPRPVAQPRPPAHPGDILRPGDDYTNRATVEDLVLLLCRHGWQRGAVQSDGTTELTRPGKDVREGISGDVTLIGGVAIFTQFSSNGGPFSPRKGYTAFSTYTLLEHRGDPHAAAKTLAAMGYGGDGQIVVLSEGLRVRLGDGAATAWRLAGKPHGGHV